jgi:hypothetical protein
VGQAAYVYRGGVTYVQVKRLTGRQAALAPVNAPAPAADGTLADATLPLPTVPAPRGPGAWPSPTVPPDASEVLDEAFGARRE